MKTVVDLKFEQREMAHSHCSVILQTAWSKYGSPEVNRENILKCWNPMFQACQATKNFKLLGQIGKVMKRLRAGIIHPTDTWFYSFLLMVESEEIRSVGFRRQRYVLPNR